MTDESVTAQSPETVYDWDFFLAHAGPDLSAAKNLYLRLHPAAKVFLDDVCLVPGDDWDTALPAAQSSSLISVVLISPHTEEAHFQREEILAAIQMVREDPSTHRVVPVYLNAGQIPNNILYGLKRKHGLYVPDSGDFAEVGQRLLKTLEMMRHYEEKKVRVVERNREAIFKLTGGEGNREVLAGLSAATQFVRPLLITLVALFVLITVLLVVCLLLPSEAKMLLAAVLGSLCAVLLASILWLTARSLNYAQQIAMGRLNAG